MQRAIAIVSQDEKLTELTNQIKKAEEHYKQRKEFFKKQMEDAAFELASAIEPLVNGVEAHLLSNNKLPKDYSKEKYHLHYDQDADVVTLCDGEGHKDPRELIMEMIRNQTTD
jgi:hypothetical protein